MERCPVCRARWIPGQQQCRRCGAELASALRSEALAEQQLHQALVCLLADQQQQALTHLDRVQQLKDSPLRRLLIHWLLHQQAM